MSDGAVGGRLIEDRFRLLTPLGRGHAGQVWQAVDEHTGRQVAVKLYRARPGHGPAVSVSHPCAVSIFFLGTHEGADYVVMELVDGVGLGTMLGEGPIPEHDAISIALGVCEALHAAHSAGVAHGNLKPSNVLIGGSGSGRAVVKVGDFTGRGDPREDMYSLGLLMEAMSGRDPVVERLLSREPYSPAQLRSILTGNPSNAADPEDEPEPDRPRLVRLAVVSGAVTVAVVIAACTWFLKPSTPPDLQSGMSSRPQPASATQPSAEPALETPAAPKTSKPPAAAPAVSPSVNAVDAINGVKTVIAGQLAAGNIQPDAASSLNDKLDDIARFQSRGQTKQVNNRIDSLKSLLMSMLRAGRVTDEGYNVILASVGKLAA